MKKTLTIALAFVLVIAISVAGTFAYLTSSASVKNTFTVGNVKIDLNETDVDKDNSTKNNAYTLIPGSSYTKDPTVTVDKDSEDCYLRMIVTISNYDKFLNAFGKDAKPQDAVTGWNQSVWPCVKMNVEGTTCTLEFRYNGIAEAGFMSTLFTEVVIPGTVTETQLEALDNTEVNIVAHAIQAENFNDAEAAWAAFDAQKAA